MPGPGAVVRVVLAVVAGLDAGVDEALEYIAALYQRRLLRPGELEEHAKIAAIDVRSAQFWCAP